MKKIQIYQNDTYKTMSFNQTLIYHDLSFFEKKEGIQIQYQNQEYFCLTSLKLENYVICVIPVRTFSMVALPNEYVVGRNKKSNLVIKDKDISNLHFKIIKKEEKYTLLDLKSTNGVYVNGKKVKMIDLKDGDEIWITQYQFTYIHGHLQVPFNMESKMNFSEISQFKKMTLIDKKVIHYQTQKIPVQSYSWSDFPMKQKLFQCIGSSIMILLSSSLSTFLLWLNQPDQMNQLLNMFCMSTTMAITFLFFGLYNRKASYQTSINHIYQKEAQYMKYLHQVFQEESNEQVLLSQCLQQQEQEFFSHQHVFDDVLIGYETSLFCEFMFKDVPFQYIDTKMNQNIDTFKQNHILLMDKPVYLEDKQCIRVFSNNDGFLQAMCMLKNDKKYVLVGKAFADSYFLGNEKCIQDGKRLWIFDEKSKENFIHNKKKNQTYVYIFNADLKPECDVYDMKLKYPFSYENHQRMNIQETISPFDLLNKECSYELVNLKVLLGLEKNGKVIELDLDETKDGVHGLVAGTTGSGKSELLALILMQLIHNNSPSLLRFILIDFKGGAFSYSFEGFAHCASVITNLDHSLERFLICMKHFIHVREKQLKEGKVSHIDDYNRLYSPKLCHLLIVVDEFAQLKEQARQSLEAIKELARIGRSLGIHLILATQKPLGVVDEQIWANTSFHICLKVSSKQDSQEVLHNDLAFQLQRPGEFILQRQTCVQGYSFYLHDEEIEYREVNDYDEVLWERQKDKTIFELFSQDILNRHDQVSPLFLPEIKDASFHNELLIYEDLSKMEHISFNLEYGQSMYVFCHESDWIQKVIPMFSGLVFVYGMEEDVDVCFHSIKECIECLFLEEEFTLIVKEDEAWMQNAQSFQKENIRLIVLGKQAHRKIKYSYFACWQVKYREELQTYFERIKISVDNWIEIHNELFVFSFNFKNTQKRIKNKVSFPRYPILGRWNQRWLYWDGTRKLLIVYAQKSLKKNIKEVIKEWPNQDKISLIYIPEYVDYFQSADYIQNQYDWDMLWIGPGYLDYAFYLKRKSVSSSLLIYWDAYNAYNLEEYESVFGAS